MSFIEKLLGGDEVEWVSLENIAHFQNAKPHEKFVSPEGGIALLTSKFISTEGKTARWINKADVLTPAVENDVALVMSDLPNGRALAKAFFVTKNNRYAANQRVCLLRVKDTDCYSPKLLYYVMNRNRQLLAYDSGYDQTHLKKDWILQVKIPIPCPENPKKSLEIQAEIVRILDTFTELTAELTAELGMRKKQYDYYREKLLTFEEDEVEWKALDDVVSFRRGSFPQPYGNSSWYDGEDSMPFVQVADVSDFGFSLNKVTKQRISKLAQPKSVFVKAGTVIVSLQGTIGRVAVTQYECYVDRTLAIFTGYKEDINKKYFAYQLKHKFDKEKQFARGSTLKTITKEEFSKFKIPIPPLEEQVRIATLLDKFDTLTHSINEGLPREIELRDKQYEYYRDLLLSFPVSGSNLAT